MSTRSEGEGKHERTRKIRSDKKIHVNPALDVNTHEKLEMLAFACNEKKTNLAYHILHLALNNENIINYIQDSYSVRHNSSRRLTPVKVNGQVVYAFKGYDSE